MTQHLQVVRRSQIDGSFTGFDGDALFKLSDGTYWLQAEYKYWYYYAYRPEVEIVLDHGSTFLRIPGFLESVAVTQTYDVIESQIATEFTGWTGDTEYELTNGLTRTG